jgi:nucleotidyltransferase substrate binding protein (TIGR01987 family)
MAHTTDKSRLQTAVDDLKAALRYEKQAREERFFYSGLSKEFEVCFEYAWKALRDEVVAAGLDAPSPRDAVKQAGALGLVADVELWLDFLRIRNLAVHDYLGVPKEEYIATIKKFFTEVRRIV